MTDLYRAQLDGYDLEIETIDDSFEKAIVRHEIPGKDGALLEDMGQKARVISFRCYFWDHGSHQTYADHIDFVKHLSSTALSELVHPQYGPVKGMVERVSIRHDDRDLTAEVDVTFVENLRGSIEDIVHEDVEAVAEDAVMGGHLEQMESFAAEVKAELGSESIGILGQTLEDGTGIYQQFQGYSQKARNYLKKVDTFVSTLEAELTEIANPANSLISSISFGTKLPGRVIGALARCIERHVLLYDSSAAAPERFVDNLRQACLNLQDKAGFARQLKVGFALQTAGRVAAAYKSDEAVRQQVRKSESGTTWDARGNYLATAVTDSILTASELEASLASLRAMLQEGVDQDRSLGSLKTLAKSLLDHVNTIKLERDRIITIELDNAMPLHLVCHRYGLNYNYAERINSINRLPNPNFTAGRVQIYAR